MTEAFKRELTQMLRPTALLQMQRYDRIVRNASAGYRQRPQPEPELLSNPTYLRAMLLRKLDRLETIRDDLVALELESLLTIAESYRICARARATRPFMRR